MKYLATLSLLFLGWLASGQLVNKGLPISITDATTVSVMGDLTNEDTLINNGHLIISGDLTNTGHYSGNGEITLIGGNQFVHFSDQPISILTVEGAGIKSLLSGLIIGNSLNLTSGLIDVSGQELIMAAGSQITGASSANYIEGKLIRQGDTLLEFPVGKDGLFTLVTLENVEGTDAGIGVELFNEDPLGIPDGTLFEVSTDRYWVITEESGTYDGSKIVLPLINETFDGPIEDLVVVSGSVGGTFTSVGQSSTTGDISSGSITSEEVVGASVVTIGQIFVDNLAPLVTINFISTSNSTTGLSGTIDDVTASLEVEIDNLTYSATVLNSGVWQIPNNTVLPLSDGYYDVLLTATDSLMNVSEELVPNAVFVDATAPVASIATVVTNDRTPRLSGAIDDEAASVRVQVDTTLYTAEVTGNSWRIANNVINALSDGYHDVVLMTEDSLGNILDVEVLNAIYVDATKPVVTVDQRISFMGSPPLGGSVDDSTATVKVTVAGETYSAVVSGLGWSLGVGVIDPPLADGQYDVMAEATDSLGNVGVDVSSGELIVETDELVVTVDRQQTNDSRPDVTGQVSSGEASVTIDLAGSSYAATNNGDGTWLLSGTDLVSPLATGLYEVEALAEDDVLGQASDTTTNELLVDLEAPIVRVNDLSTFDNRPKITGLVNDLEADITVSLKGKDYAAENVGDSSWFVSRGVVDYLGVGVYDVEVRAVDGVGNVGFDAGEIVILPRGVIALEPRNETVNSFEAVWTSDPGARYLLTVSLERNAREKLLLKDELVEDTTYVVRGLDYGQSYYYRVRAVYSSGDTSNYSNIIAARTLTDPFTELDSLALVEIFHSTEGVYWANRGGWLQLRLYEWEGVEMGGGTRVLGVDLSANNLVGEIGDVLFGLDALERLDVSGNDLRGIGDVSGLLSLDELDVRDNRLEFDDVLPLLSGGYALEYAPQGEVLERVRTLQQVGDSYEVVRAVGGGETYSWFKDGEPISERGSGFVVEIDDFSDEGSFHAEVTSSLVSGLTLVTAPVDLRVSSLQRDSTALIAIYDALVTGGSDVTNWPGLPMSEWEEIEIESERVVEIDLSNQSLMGDMPDDILDVGSLREADFSGNGISLIPDLSELSSLVSFDVSSNRLDFASIEVNVDVSGIDYSDQSKLGVIRDDTINRGEDYYPSIIARGDFLQYQWYFEGEPLFNANQDFYAVRDIDITTMGRYHVEVRSSIVSDFVLESEVQRVTATADIEYFPGFSYADGVRGLIDEGQSLLFRIEDSGPYDTVGIVPVNNQAVLFEDVVLGDYLLLVETDTNYFKTKEFNYTADSISVDTVKFIPTYYVGALEWDSAQVLELRDFISDTLEQLRVPPPLTPDDGDGVIGLLVESEFEDEQTGRVEARRRVKKAGCSLRRRTRGGGGRVEEDEWILIAYKETDDNGNVDFGFLPAGTYRLNIQYPGVPMDPTSFIEFDISEEEEQDGYKLGATIFEDGIFVEVLEELGFYRKYFKDLQVYPNPADQELHISYKRLNAQRVEVELLNLQGQKLMSDRIEKGVNRELVFDVSGLRPGIYLLHFYDEAARDVNERITAYKVIIRH